MGLKNTYQAKKRFTKVPVSKTGMWYQDGDVVVPSNQITMKGPQGQLDYFDSPIVGTGMQSGQTQVMQPGREYSFPNDNSVYERKMQNGAINLTEDIKRLNPNPQKNNFNSALTTADMITDVMQMGHFIPHPIGQAVGYLGDFLGAGVDLTQSAINTAEGDYQGAAINLGLGLLPGAVGKRGYKRANSLISGKGSGYYRPLQSLPHLKNNPVIKQGLMFNKAKLGANALEVGSNINFNNNQNNSFGGYQDNLRPNTPTRPDWYNSQQWDKAMKSQMRNGGQINWLNKYQVGGNADPEFMFKNKYNTELTSSETADFSKWVAKESQRQGRDILNDIGAYDVKGFWKSGDYKNMDSDNHGTDTWKKPNHPTFSNQSRYHGADGWYGGNWTDKAGYQPSKQTLETYGPDYYDWMFKSEPGRSEYLDMSRYESGINKPTPFVYQIGGETSTEQNPERMDPVNISVKRRNQDYRTYNDNTVNNNQIVPSEFRGKRYVQPTLSEYVEPSIGNRILNTLASPMTALSNNRTGSRNPYDYALDMVNPFSWIQSGERAVGSLSEGQYGDAALNALGALPAIGFADDAGRALSKAGNYATTQAPLKNAYKYNPLAFKANPKGYYRVLGKEGLDDAFESGVIRASQKNVDEISGEPFYDRPYFSKSVPLDRDFKSPLKKKGKQSTGSPYPDDTMVEVFGDSRFYPSNNLVTSPINTLTPFDEGINFYKRDWLQGYKKVNPPKPQKQNGGLQTSYKKTKRFK